MLDLCTLGTGGAIPLPERGLASLYLRVNGRGLLIDCGESTQTAIRRVGWGFKTIDGMLLTHYHADHCSGIPGFLLSMGKSQRTEPFHIWGGPGLRQVISGLCVVVPQLPFQVVLHEFDADTQEIEMLGLDITAFRVEHSVPCYGYSIRLNRAPAFDPQKARALGVPVKYWGVLQSGQTAEVDGRIIQPDMVLGAPRCGLHMVYCTDTRPTPRIAQMGCGSDLMILEGMYGDDTKRPQALKNRHMIFHEAAALARDAGTKQLVLTHFSNCIDEPDEYLPGAQAVFPETVCAQDLMEMTLRFPLR